MSSPRNVYMQVSQPVKFSVFSSDETNTLSQYFWGRRILMLAGEVREGTGREVVVCNFMIRNQLNQERRREIFNTESS